MSIRVHQRLQFAFMSRARGQGQLHAPNGSGVSEQARYLSLCLLLLGSCSRHLAVGCSSLGSLRGTCECKKHIFKQVDVSAWPCRLGSKNFSHVLS